MTEIEWFDCTDPTPMLEFLRANEKIMERRLRQFAIGCCCRVWHLMPNEGKQLIEVVERFAEGKLIRRQRDAAVATFRAAHGRFGANTPILRAAYRCKNMSIDAFTANIVGENIAVAAGNAVGEIATHSAICNAAYSAERAGQATLIRCIFGNPFRPVTVNPGWLNWNDGTIPRIAQAIYEERAFDRMPILADALEDADCDNADILAHCRSEEPHNRGCWLVDLLLGKE